MTSLSLGRIGVGVAAVARPDLAGGAIGVDPLTNPQAAYVVRLFGVREVALGVATLLAAGTARRNLVVVGVAVDVADAVTGIIAVRRRDVALGAGATLLGPALGAVFSGIRSLRAARR